MYRHPPRTNVHSMTQFGGQTRTFVDVITRGPDGKSGMYRCKYGCIDVQTPSSDKCPLNDSIWRTKTRTFLSIMDVYI